MPSSTDIPEIPYCWRRRAPASTRFGVTSIAAKYSNRWSANYQGQINMAQRLKTDWILFITVLCMVTGGILVVYSASSIMAEIDPRYHSAWHFVSRQAAWAVIAIGIMMALKN